MILHDISRDALTTPVFEGDPPTEVQRLKRLEDLDECNLTAVSMTTHAGTGFMHESFHPDDPAKFTRTWFAWANSMLGELVYRLYEDGRLAEVLDIIRN